MYFPVNFAKYLRTPFLQNTNGRPASDQCCDKEPSCDRVPSFVDYILKSCSIHEQTKIC